ncbi:hypothetical protein [Xanthomonas cerealis]|uniref:hypothetical protein n=1 Tax=Xanthomonas cerealis TaxID=3390025 RepID=UPI001F32A7E3|nr:hypothetical protein [Xanthomonas translucens]UKE69151.1 hypothetical protein K8O61_17175 [Xanthomonas translucens pv. pistacia]
MRPSARRFLWRTRWQAHVADALENFLDPLHTHLLHPWLVRHGGARSTEGSPACTWDGRWAPTWAVRWLVWPLLRKVGEQDRRMLALQSHNLQRFPGVRGACTALDPARDPLRRYWDGEPLPAPGAQHGIDLML